MKEYIVRKTPGRIVVWRDGERIELKGLFDAIAQPKYDFGKMSESSLNLGHAILVDCVGEAAAGQLYEGFTQKYLMVEAMELPISADEIREYAKVMARRMYNAQSKTEWKMGMP